MSEGVRLKLPSGIGAVVRSGGDYYTRVFVDGAGEEAGFRWEWESLTGTPRFAESERVAMLLELIISHGVDVSVEDVCVF